jgi:hypothetical protein
VHLSREQINELVALAGNLIEERRRIRRVLEQLPEISRGTAAAERAG